MGFLFSAEPFSTATGNDFWGQNVTPVEAETTGNLGEQGMSEVGDLCHCCSREGAVGTEHQNLCQGKGLSGLSCHVALRKWKTALDASESLLPVYSNPLEDCFKELRMNKFPFQVSLGFLIINEFSVHLKQIKHCHWELPGGLGHFWNSCCWVYYESKGAELQNLIGIVEQKMEK